MVCALVAGASLALPGCVLAGAPLPLGRFAPLPTSSRGRVTATSEVVVRADGTSAAAYLPVGIGSLTLHLAPWYDLAVSSGGGLATVEGDLAVFDGDGLRLGLTHGAGLGFSVATNGASATAVWGAGLGLLAVTPGSRSLLVSVGWRYDSGGGLASTAGAGAAAGPATHTVYLAVGCRLRQGGLDLTPEVTAATALVPGAPRGRAQSFLLTAGLSVAAPF